MTWKALYFDLWMLFNVAILYCTTKIIFVDSHMILYYNREIKQTVDMEIKSVMTSQRVRVAESRIRNSLTNGPWRA